MLTRDELNDLESSKGSKTRGIYGSLSTMLMKKPNDMKRRKFRRQQHDSMWSPFTFDFYRHLTTLCIKSDIICLDCVTVMKKEMFSIIRTMTHEPTKQSNNQFS